MAKEGHLLLTTWHCPVQCVTFVTNSTQTNVRIHSYKVFDTNECLYRYLRFLNSFATRSTANDGWTSSSPKCKMDPTVGQGPSDTDQTGIFSRHWCATICKGSPASTQLHLKIPILLLPIIQASVHLSKNDEKKLSPSAQIVSSRQV